MRLDSIFSNIWLPGRRACRIEIEGILLTVRIIHGCNMCSYILFVGLAS
jgi:hypothetical protein